MQSGKDLVKILVIDVGGTYVKVLASGASESREAGRLFAKVDARGTSQRCPCGAKVPKKLSDREHVCTKCGLITTRDHASATEILRLD